jgi:predicted small metal-binding protein
MPLFTNCREYVFSASRLSTRVFLERPEGGCKAPISSTIMMGEGRERPGNGIDRRRCFAMRALLCGCQQRLAASDEEALFERVLEHLRERHPVLTLSEAQIREVVAARSYGFEEMALAGADPEEEFGIDPY